MAAHGRAASDKLTNTHSGWPSYIQKQHAQYQRQIVSTPDMSAMVMVPSTDSTSGADDDEEDFVDVVAGGLVALNSINRFAYLHPTRCACNIVDIQQHI